MYIYVESPTSKCAVMVAVILYPDPSSIFLNVDSIAAINSTRFNSSFEFF